MEFYQAVKFPDLKTSISLFPYGILKILNN